MGGKCPFPPEELGLRGGRTWGEAVSYTSPGLSVLTPPGTGRSITVGDADLLFS